MTMVDTVKFSGLPVDPATNPITISTGWNWIGYIPQTSKTVPLALNSIGTVADDYIKNQTNSSTYYTGTGWFGEMLNMDPLDGYMLKTSHSATLTYPAGGELLKVIDDVRLMAEINEYESRFKLHDPVTGHASWVTDFEFSGQVTASVYLNGQNLDSTGYTLYSMVNDQVRGVSKSRFFSPTGEWVHSHMIFSNVSQGDTVRFRLEVLASGDIYDFDECLIFNSDMIKANAYEPFRLQKSHLLAPTSLSLQPSLSVWPNPVTDQLQIRYSTTNTEPINILIVNNLGRIVKHIPLGVQPKGEFSLISNLDAFPSGIYQIMAEGHPETVQKLVKIN
jgi:hypothetical protein